MFAKVQTALGVRIWGFTSAFVSIKPNDVETSSLHCSLIGLSTLETKTKQNTFFGGGDFFTSISTALVHSTTIIAEDSLKRNVHIVDTEKFGEVL